MLRFGPGVCGDLEEASRREWLVSDGLGGFAMGTVAGLRTRRYHGLLVVATQPPIGRQLALAALDPVLVVGDARVRLGTLEWAGGAVDPAGHVLLASFGVLDGVPTWRWRVGGVVLESAVAMARGRPAVAVTYRLLGGGPVRLELGALCTWRDVHGERFAGADPDIAVTNDGFVFEGRYRVQGPGFEPDGAWYRGAWAREEAARGLNAAEDLWHAGRFTAELRDGESIGVTAWADRLDDSPGRAASIVDAAQERSRRLRAAAPDAPTQLLTLAADQFVVAGPAAPGPTVVAGYPWFGDWSRDTMTSYEGLFLATGRVEEGRRLLRAAAATLSEGMLANTADAGGTEYNTADGTLWFVHAVARHVDRTGDTDLTIELLPSLEGIVAHHVAGTRFGISVDPADGLVRQGADGWALTWMDARVDGRPVTQRAGKPVEVNALWVNALAAIARLLARVGRDDAAVASLHARAQAGFLARFRRRDGLGLLDVVDGPAGDDASLRPNQLLAVSLPDGPLARDVDVARAVVRACTPLLTPLGLRSLGPMDPAYLSAHRGAPEARDRAYHQGTVWPWLAGPYSDAARRCGEDPSPLLEGLVAHLGEWGLGSVSETADGAPPHAATGCPFQAWSVAELLRVTRAG
ncbi:MAG TPA: amylo-alpha-1,6-glucosidase [Acidimicrobiales bacterium]|nr:amylo-alpha-1,6-glucosidase [Acidimicrobiales bacterium]